MRDIKDVFRIAEEMFQKKESGIVYLIFPDSKEILGYPNDEGTKQFFLAYLKRYCSDKNITDFYVVSEAWRAVRTEADKNSTVRPSDDPEREDIYIVSHITKTNTTVSMALIHGGDDIRFLGEWSEFMNNGTSIWQNCL